MAEDAAARSGQASTSQGDASPFAPPQITLPKGGGAIRGIDEKFTRQSGHRHRLAERSVAAQPGPLGLRAEAFPRLRFGHRQRDLRHGLEPVPAVDHPPDRQGAAAISRRRGIGHLRSLGRRGSGPGLCATEAAERSSTSSSATAIASSATGRASKACSPGSSAGLASTPARRIGARCRRTTSSPSTGSMPNRASPIPKPTARLQLADLPQL